MCQSGLFYDADPDKSDGALPSEIEQDLGGCLCYIYAAGRSGSSPDPLILSSGNRGKIIGG